MRKFTVLSMCCVRTFAQISAGLVEGLLQSFSYLFIQVLRTKPSPEMQFSANLREPRACAKLQNIFHLLQYANFTSTTAKKGRLAKATELYQRGFHLWPAPSVIQLSS